MKTRIFAFVFYVVCGFLPFFAYAQTNASGLFLRPSQGSFFVGSTFDVSIVLDTKGAAINTVEVELLFPSDILQVASPSTGYSIVQVWASPPLFSNKEGKVYFVGGIPSPGIETSNGIVLTMTFRAIAPGEAKIEFGPQTKVLANDALGTNVLGQSPPAFFKFSVSPPQGPEISSPSHSDQLVWYKDPNPIFVWSKSPFSGSFSYLIDQDPSGVPDTISESKSSTATFQNLESGIWYFHLREEAGGVWGGVSHYAVKIDKDLPASFDVNVSPGLRTTNKNPVFRFFTTDSLSGLDHYEIKIIPLSHGDITEGLFFETTSPYQASNLKSGRNQIIVRALDKAGNTRDSSKIITMVTPLTRFLDADGINLGFIFISWSGLISWLFFLFLLVILIFWGLWSRHKSHIGHIFWKDVRNFISFFKKNNHLTFFVFFALIMVLPFVSFAAGKEILPPIINIVPEQYYSLDDILYIEGKTGYSYSPVEILFERVSGGASNFRFQVKSNSVGDWFLSQKTELASGEWYVRARVLLDPPSDWSNPRIIRSVVSGFNIGGIKIKYIPMAGMLIILLMASAALFVYMLFRTRSIRRMELEKQIQEKTEALEKKLKNQEKKELDLIIGQNFDDIKRSLAEELKHFESRVKNGESLSVDEEQHKADILKKLRETEEKIEKKIHELS